MNAFFKAQFNYCLLIWMFHSRQNNNEIKHLYEKCLRLIHNHKLSSYEELLEKDESAQFIKKTSRALLFKCFR